MKWGNSILLTLMFSIIVILTFCRNTRVLSDFDSEIKQQGDVCYYNESGHRIFEISNSGRTRNYVIKTKQKIEDIYEKEEIGGKSTQKGGKPFIPVEVKSISAETAWKVEQLIKSGMINDSLVKNNVIEIIGNDAIAAIFISIRDNGTGETDSTNNREYGGLINDSNSVYGFVTGKIQNPCNYVGASLEIKGEGPSEFHSHPSGTRGKCFFSQGPSDDDRRGLKENRRGYVLGMRSKVIYVYDRSGILATLSFRPPFR